MAGREVGAGAALTPGMEEALLAAAEAELVADREGYRGPDGTHAGNVVAGLWRRGLVRRRVETLASGRRRAVVAVTPAGIDLAEALLR